MALEENIRKQLEGYVALLENDVVITASLGDDSSSIKMREFLEEIEELSSKIQLVEEKLDRTPSFRLDSKDQIGRVTFAAIPLGHELSTFVLALVQSSGRTPKIEESQIKRIKQIKEKLHFDTYVSLSCHICPDVVQAINVIAILNENITSTMVDGGIFQNEIEDKAIMAVPTIFLNDEEFNAGRVTLDELLEQILGKAELDVDVSELYDVLIVGGGPAGVSSAIYSARKGLKVAMITDRIGGQVLETFSIENLIGTKYTEGPKLATDLHEHLKDYDIDIINNQTVIDIKKEDNAIVTLDGGVEISGRVAIIATGARWRNVNVPGEAEFKNKGVAYCPHCDGPLFEGKKLAVIGGGNSGIEAAIDLANVASHVTVVEFADSLKADEVLQDAVAKIDNVDIVLNAATTEITGVDSVNGLVYDDRTTSASHSVEVDGVFVQIGLIPNTEFLKDTFEKTPMGEIIVNHVGETSIPGIFAAGDCTNSSYKQIIISMGAGATAALGAFDYLIRNK